MPSKAVGQFLLSELLEDRAAVQFEVSDMLGWVYMGLPF